MCHHILTSWAVGNTPIRMAVYSAINEWITNIDDVPEKLSVVAAV